MLPVWSGTYKIIDYCKMECEGLQNDLSWRKSDNPFIPNGLFYLNFISKLREFWLVLIIPRLIEFPVFNAINEDPDQTPHSVASVLDLHCLPMSHLWCARHKEVHYENMPIKIYRKFHLRKLKIFT